MTCSARPAFSAAARCGLITSFRRVSAAKQLKEDKIMDGLPGGKIETFVNHFGGRQLTLFTAAKNYLDGTLLIIKWSYDSSPLNGLLIWYSICRDPSCCKWTVHTMKSMNYLPNVIKSIKAK